MEIINSTPVPVTIAVTGDVEDEPRTGILTAKATFRIGNDGKVKAERDEPFDLLDEDESTEFGLFPADNLPRVDPSFEVILLGCAHSPDGSPVEKMKVALSIGDERREIDVIGDREWRGEGKGVKPSRPEPFTRMPLILERAFGGSAEVLIDVDSAVDLTDPVNPVGKGFDHVGQAQELGKVMKSPDGFPQFDMKRELPNLEDPGNPIRRWDDNPVPACWATPPLHSGILVERLRRKKAEFPDHQIVLGEPEMLYRAHPDWVVDMPAAGAPVSLVGVDPGGEINFRLPQRKVVCDIRIGKKHRSLELIPRMLVLLPEQRKFYMVYRHFFRFRYEPLETRVVRVREEDGWTTNSGEN